MSIDFKVAGTSVPGAVPDAIGMAVGGVRMPDPGGAEASWSAVQNAEKGATGIGSWNFEDATAAQSFLGLAPLAIDESGCTSFPRLFSGYLEERQLGRTPAMRVGAQRNWDANILDLNVLLTDKIIESGKRPSETDIERITWLVQTSGYLTSVGWDPDLIDTSNPVTLPADDYTGRYAADVLSDCSNLSNKNYYVTWSYYAFFLALPADYDLSGGRSMMAEYPPYPEGEQFIGQGIPENADLAANPTYYVKVDINMVGVLALWRWAGGAPGYTGGCSTIPWLGSDGERSYEGDQGFLTFDDACHPSDGRGWSIAHQPDPTYKVGGPVIWDWYGGWHLINDPYPGYPDMGDAYTVRARLWAGHPGPALAYHPVGWADNSSTIRVSNVLADIDNTTTFGCSSKDTIGRNPEKVYSGCYFEYSGGHAYVANPTTLAAYFPDSALGGRQGREVRASDLNCKTWARAMTLATAYLDRVNSEEDRGVLHLEHVPAAAINLVRAGQRMEIKLSHVPGYESFTWVAVISRTVRPNSLDFYDLDLEVGTIPLTGFHGGAGHGWDHPVRPAPYAANPLLTGSSSDDPATAQPGQWITEQFLGMGDGMSTVFMLPSSYLPDSVRVFVAGIEQYDVDEFDPATGEIHLGWAPAAIERVSAIYQAG